MRISAVLLLLWGSFSHADDESYTYVSMIDLIANPAFFVDQTITLRGYLDFEIAKNMHLFPTKDHALMDDFASSLLVGNYIVGDSDIGRICGGNYASIEGKFLRSDMWVSPGRWMHHYRFEEINSVEVLSDSGVFEGCYER